MMATFSFFADIVTDIKGDKPHASHLYSPAKGVCAYA